MEKNYKKVKYACYSSNVAMAVVSTLSPILFLTFHNLYGISYSLLGLLVLINFVTQLGIDLVFSFFSHKFNISKTVKTIPVLTVLGLVVYACWAWIFPNSVYVGFVLGTLIFSASAGLGEVLISPVIASIPAENPDKEMSKLHSIYAWGVVGVVLFCTLFLLIFKNTNWQWLTLSFTLVSFVSFLLFATAEIPEMERPEKTSGALSQMKDKKLWLSVFAIFLGGASECTMAQWSSGYLEQAFGIEKVWGDIFGVALFAVALGLGRSMYAKKGKNIVRVLVLGAIGATVCYLIASLSGNPIIGLIACAFTGFCVSMLWPGNLIVASERFPHGGVFLYAMMAAGGDLGASVGPQLVGVITDFAMVNPSVVSLATSLAITPEQLGMRLGILVGMLFPLIAIFVYSAFLKAEKKKE